MSTIKIDHDGNVIHNGKTTAFDSIVYQEADMLKTLNGSDVIDKNLSSVSLIETPVITSPNSGTVGFEGDIMLGGYVVKNDSFSGLHTSTDWEFATDFQFENIVLATHKDVNNLHQLANYSIDDNTMMYVRVRYRSDEFLSHWSVPVAYRSSNIDVSTPVITLKNESVIGRNITIVTSPYTVSGDTDTHISTDWIVATDNLFNNIIHNGVTDVDNKVELALPVTLSYDTEYFIKVRQHGDNYSTEWSYRTIRTTGTVETPVMEIGVGVASEGTLIGTISNYESDQSYYFTSSDGVIVDNGNGTFTYTAPEAPGTTDITAEVKLMSTMDGAVNSDYGIVNITVFHAGYFEDDVMINLDFNSNVVYNDGFN